MRLICAYTVALSMAIATVTFAVSCAPKSNAELPSFNAHNPHSPKGLIVKNAETPEEMIRRSDSVRLANLDEFETDSDGDIYQTEEPGIPPDQLRYSDSLEFDESMYMDEERSDFWHKFGLVSFTVFSIAFKLGMMALPFLV
jgi:hypothetical protein